MKASKPGKKGFSSISFKEMASKEQGNDDDTNLKAFDIAELLQAKFVFLSGGKDKNGFLILTVPCQAKLSTVTEKNLEKVLMYLINLHVQSPQSTDHGFTFILDKRKGKWSSVNNTLTKLQKIFPARVNCVYVLKPQGLLQKFIGGGLSSEEAQAAFRIVVLGSTGDLEKYIAVDQLTTDLGGHLDYKHDEWIQHRTAIERFEKTIHQLEVRLERLRKLFDKTNITSSIDEMENILETQEEMWKDVKEDIASAQLTGATLQRCIYPQSDDNIENSVTPDVQSNAVELEGLLKRLNNSEDAFLKFWESHEMRIRQGLELSLFEQEIGQVTGLVLVATGKVSAMTDVGNCKAAAETLREELREFAGKSQDPISRAKNLAQRGMEMVENGHYSRETIQLSYKGLQQLCVDFNKHVETMDEKLKSAMDIHECLEQVSKWCTKGVDLLASQPVEKFQYTEGAEKSLEEIDNFLKDRQGISLKKLNRLEKMSKDLGNKYLIYKVKDCLKRIGEVNDMMTKRENSLKRLVVKRPVQPVTALPVTSSKEEVKRKVSSSSLDEKKVKSSPKPRRPVSIVVTCDSEPPSPDFNRWQPVKSVSVPDLADVVDGKDTPEMMKKRTQIMTELVATERYYVADLECIINGYVKEFENAGDRIPLELFGKKDIIFGNIEEICNFHRRIFLKELEKYVNHPQLVGEVFTGNREEFEMYALYCKNKPSSEALQQQLINLPFIKECQSKLGHKLPLTAYLLKPVQRITKYQLLLREMMKNTRYDRIAYMNLMEALHAMQSVLRHLNDVMHSSGLKGYQGNLADLGKLLLQDSFLVWHTRKKIRPLKGRQRQVFLYQKMVIFSRREEDQNSKDSVTYHYKNSLEMCDVGFTEKVKGAPCKFELWLPRRKEVFMLQALAEEVKERWTSEIRCVLQSQFNQVKDEQANRLQDHGKWRSSPALTDEAVSGTKRARAKSQSTLALDPDSLASRCSDIAEEDNYDDDGFDSDEWSDSDESEEHSPQTHPLQEANGVSDVRSVFAAVTEYVAVEAGEVTMQEGDGIQLLRVGSDGWWFVRHAGTWQEGWVPASYLQPA